MDYVMIFANVLRAIFEIVNKASIIYLLYEIYNIGELYININNWSYKITVVILFHSIASVYLISFSSYVSMLLYKGYYNALNFNRINFL